MKISIFFLSLLFLTNVSTAQNTVSQKSAITALIESWHKAAATANYDAYFNVMSENSIFIGTDASEIWTKKQFQDYAKPYFEKGKAWSFTTLQRNIYFSEDHKMAWFDELLDTQMKICRGSGVLVKVDDQWKIAHYVLSVSIPNELSTTVTILKADTDDVLLKKLKS